MRGLVIVFLLLVAQLVVATASNAQVLQVDGGRIAGKPWNGSILFRGIPFAAPPLGELRWRTPQPVRPWKGVRGSAEHPPSCIQGDQGWNHADFVNQSEDCLTLDVRTPKLGGKLPVLVWIHGGSNRYGGPNDIVLSDVGQQVVIVGIRYRLGIFGFLSHARLTSEQGRSGNYGLMDQIAALKWVQRNIAKFGGDPANVTIAGESAGSEDVALMLGVPAAAPLFQKAIMESGTPGFGLAFRSLAEAERIGSQLDQLLGTRGDLGKLRKASPQALLAADMKLHDPGAPDDSFLWLRTTVDRRLVRADPRQLLASTPPKPVIVGSNRIEFGLGGGPAERDRLIASAFGANAARARAVYRLNKPEDAPDPRFGSRDEQIATDIIFRCPASHLAQVMASRGARVWQYEFDAAPGRKKTFHAAEIPYAFGDAKLGNGLSLKAYWLNFIWHGDPNGPRLPRWPQFTAARPKVLLVNEQAVAPVSPVHGQVCSLLTTL